MLISGIGMSGNSKSDSKITAATATATATAVAAAAALESRFHKKQLVPVLVSRSAAAIAL